MLAKKGLVKNILKILILVVLIASQSAISGEVVYTYDIPTRRENGDIMSHDEVSHVEIRIVSIYKSKTESFRVNLPQGDHRSSVRAVDNYGVYSKWSDDVSFSEPRPTKCSVEMVNFTRDARQEVTAFRERFKCFYDSFYPTEIPGENKCK